MAKLVDGKVIRRDDGKVLKLRAGNRRSRTFLPTEPKLLHGSANNEAHLTP